MSLVPNFKPEDSETIFSMVSRYHLLSGHLSYLDTLRAIFGNHKKRIHPYLPSQLECVGDHFNFPPNYLLTNHTLYPLFSFSTPDTSGKLIKSMMTNSGSTILNAHLPHFKMPMFTGHKYCPICATEEFNKLGCTLWHIEHQVPGIIACALHEVELIGIDNSDGELDRKLILPPTTGIIKPACNADIRLAQYANLLLKCIPSFTLSLPIVEVYRKKLREKGFRSDNGTLKFEQIRCELLNFWQELSLKHELGFSGDISDFSFIGPLLRLKTGMSAHPFKHLLFSYWLFDGRPDIQSQIFTPDIPTNIGTSPQDIEQSVVFLLKAGKSMNDIESITGKSRCYIRRIAELNGYYHATNSQRYSDSIRRKVQIKALHGQHRLAIAKSLSVGIGYVEQVISNTKGLVGWRKHLRHADKLNKAVDELTKVRKEHPDWRRKDIKAYCSSAFFTLYHHSRAVLEKLLPPKTKPVAPPKNWDKEDKRLYAAINAIENAKDYSLSRIDKLTKARGSLRKYLSKLPKTRILLHRLKITKKSRR